MEILSFIALVCVYLWLDLEPFEEPAQTTAIQDPLTN